jgi:coenzyme F420-dependent glucose-6-phosphate dehydrogenase
MSESPAPANPAIGLALSSEEHPPNELVRQALLGEMAGFGYALVSDHFHPWVDAQGHSPFVWSVIGAIAQVTDNLRVGTGVTCPIIRIHPAVIAQAAATCAAMMPGRFFLGLGTGENLNEHITGAPWPAADERQDMLEEAIGIIRLLWEGGDRTRRTTHYRVENARIYTLPDPLPEIYVAASGEQAAEMAAKIGDGLISTAPKEETIKQYERAGGNGKPKYGQVTVCWDTDEKRARKTAHETWPNAAIGGELSQELPIPRHFEQAAEMVTEDDVAERVACGPDPERHVESIKKYLDAGYDHVYVHQVGKDPVKHDGFFEFYKTEVLPRLS